MVFNYREFNAGTVMLVRFQEIISGGYHPVIPIYNLKDKGFANCR
jgi:hypothetical protein